MKIVREKIRAAAERDDVNVWAQIFWLEKCSTLALQTINKPLISGSNLRRWL